MPLKSLQKVLSFDLGGTKIAVAVIDKNGQFHEIHRSVVNLSRGIESLTQQFLELGRPLVEAYNLKTGVIASAGPLDPIAGILLNPTNLKYRGRSLGTVPLVKMIQKKLKIEIKLENDAAAAALAEYWMGRCRGSKNLLAVTLGTGLGVGVIANGKLLRSGRNLHTEAGHIILDYQDKKWMCGCGNFGCAEAFLSGVNFTKFMAKKLGLRNLKGEELTKLARDGNKIALSEFKIYGDRLAAFLFSQIVIFSPEQVILSGGFSHSADLFLPNVFKKLEKMLTSRRKNIDLMPEIHISNFRDEAGLLGAAYKAFFIPN